MIDRINSWAIDLLARLVVLLMFRFEVSDALPADGKVSIAISVRRRFAWPRKSAQA